MIERFESRHREKLKIDKGILRSFANTPNPYEQIATDDAHNNAAIKLFAQYTRNEAIINILAHLHVHHLVAIAAATAHARQIFDALLHALNVTFAASAGFVRGAYAGTRRIRISP